MKIEELFPGAVFQIEGQIRTANIVSKYGSVLYDVGIIERNDSIADCSGVQITPEILMRLEGESGERFGLVNGFYFINGGIRVWCEEDKVGVDWFYKNPFNGCFFGIGNINDVISRVRLDAGIFLTLKPE